MAKFNLKSLTEKALIKAQFGVLNLRSAPEEIKNNKEVVLLALNKENNYQYIPQNLQNDFDVSLTYLCNFPQNYKKIPSHFLEDEDFLNKAISINKNVFFDVKENHKNLLMYKIAFKNNLIKIEDFPQKFFKKDFDLFKNCVNIVFKDNPLSTEDLYLLANKLNVLSPKNIPEELYKNIDFVKKLIKQNKDNFAKIPFKTKTTELYLLAIQLKIINLKEVPNKFIPKIETLLKKHV